MIETCSVRTRLKTVVFGEVCVYIRLCIIYNSLLRFVKIIPTSCTIAQEYTNKIAKRIESKRMSWERHRAYVVNMKNV
jgi:hypothetical protein